MTKKELQIAEILRDINTLMFATYKFDGGEYVRLEQMLYMREEVNKALELLTGKK